MCCGSWGRKELDMTTGKTTALTRRTFVEKVMSLFFNMLFRLVLDYKEIQPVHSEGDQPWDFFGRKVMTNLSSVHFSRLVVSSSLRPHESQHIRPPYPSPSPGVHSDSRPSSP